MRIKETIQDKLSKREVHQLISLCKKYSPLPLHILQAHEDLLDKNKKNYLGKSFYKKLLDVRKIHSFFQKAGVLESDYLQYWGFLREFYRNESNEYKKKTKPERKDNKDYINYGSSGSNRNKIRYPKKVRKTAWKRFYRLFPSLDPEREKKLNEELTSF